MSMAHRHFHLHPVVAARDHAHRPALRHAGAARSGRALAHRRGDRSADAAPDRPRRRARGPHGCGGTPAAPGSTTADAVFGLAWSGAMTARRVAAILGRLPPGIVEIYLHPADAEQSFAGAAPGYRYADEFAALCDADCIAAVQRSGYALGGYSTTLDSRVMARAAAPPRRDGEIARRFVPARRGGLVSVSACRPDIRRRGTNRSRRRSPAGRAAR